VLSFDVPDGTPDDDVREILTAAYAQIEDARTAAGDAVDVSDIREHSLSEATVYALGSILDVVSDGLPDDVYDAVHAFVTDASGGPAL
jgi:hypothetical protein